MSHQTSECLQENWIFLHFSLEDGAQVQQLTYSDRQLSSVVETKCYSHVVMRPLTVMYCSIKGELVTVL